MTMGPDARRRAAHEAVKIVRAAWEACWPLLARVWEDEEGYGEVRTLAHQVERTLGALRASLDE